jgi:YidC/Oxa1 family membrane protein insertase
MLYGVPLSLLVSGFIFPIGVLIYWVTNNAWTFGQQYFILRKMPPPGSPAALARAAADKPAVESRTLPPKPGAKPVRTKPAPPAGPQASANGVGNPAGNPPATPAGNPAGGAPPNKAKRKRR